MVLPLRHKNGVPAPTCTGDSTFAESCDVSFTTGTENIRSAGGSWNSFRSWTVRSTNRRGTAKIGGSRRSRTVPSCASDRRSPARASEPSFRVDLHHDFPLIRRACFVALRKGKLAESAGNAPASGLRRISFSGRVPPAYIGLDSMAPSRGFAPRPLALTGRWTTVIPRWKRNWSPRQDSHLRPAP